jgi:carboxymethylenebutenolidase
MLTTALFALAVFVSGPGSSVPLSCCDPMAVFATDPAFIAAHPAPRPLRFAPKEGKQVSFHIFGGPDAGGFLVPPRTDHSPAIVMVHEWWGLNDYIRREAERLHDELGYAVLAIDLYDGKIASTPQEAGKLMGAVKPERATAIVTAAMSGLRGGTFGRAYDRIGTIGWCFGGGWSDRAAIAGGNSVKACVMYYGMPDTDPVDLQRLQAPVLMMWAKKDAWINKSVVDGFKTAMATNHKSLVVLPFDAGHGFANPSNPIYDKISAAKAWAATISFYKRNLGE